MIKPFINPFSLLHFKETFTPKNILANLITWLNGAISLSLMFKSFINSARTNMQTKDIATAHNEPLIISSTVELHFIFFILPPTINFLDFI